MTIIIIITYSLEFSTQVINYFKFQNIYNGFKFTLLPIGLDMGNEDEILDIINNKISSYKNVEVVSIFSDVGLPNKLAKRIKFQDSNIKVFRSTGALIENGFLTYLMLNTKAPIETLENIINDKIEK